MHAAAALATSISNMSKLSSPSPQAQGKPAGNLIDPSPQGLEDMVKALMPRFTFEGEPAKIVGQVGLQPELALLCKCCGKVERKKTLICDACENSFHLKCLKLRSSHALLLDRWLCASCSADIDGALPVRSFCVKDSVRSPSFRRWKDTRFQQASPREENEPGKIRFVLKLKTAHFKGSRSLAESEVASDWSAKESREGRVKRPNCQMLSDMSTDESTESSVKGRNSCQMQCLSCTENLGLPFDSSPEVCTEVIAYDRHQNKKVKMAETVSVSERDAHDAALMLPSSWVECSSLGYQCQPVADFEVCGDACKELNTARGTETKPAQSTNNLVCPEGAAEVEIQRNFLVKFLGRLSYQNKQINSNLHLLGTAAKKTSEHREDEAYDIEDLVLERRGKEVVNLVIKQSTQSHFSDKRLKQIEDVCKLSEVEMEEKARSATRIMASKAEIAVEPSPECSKAPIGAVTDVRPELNVYACTHERVQMDVEENRSLVPVPDNIQKGQWYSDAIELMGLEPFVCHGEPISGDHEPMLSSQPHSQVHVKLNTWCLLQAYADCRERGIIVYDLGKVKGHDAEASRKAIDIERTWSLGKGFYALLLGSKEAANESVWRRMIPFRGGIGYAIPYVPSFSPEQELQDTCPVWVTFVHLPIYFHPFLRELALALGTLLYLPRDEPLESSYSPRVCICWKISRQIPDFLYVDLDGLGCKKLKIEFDLALLRKLSKH